MEYLHTDRMTQDYLRIVFNDRVVLLRLGDHATMGDVAQTLRDFEPRRYGDPVAIDVTIGGVRQSCSDHPFSCPRASGMKTIRRRSSIVPYRRKRSSPFQAMRPNSTSNPDWPE
jgi:hypothetical protein